MYGLSWGCTGGGGQGRPVTCSGWVAACTLYGIWCAMGTWVRVGCQDSTGCPPSSSFPDVLMSSFLICPPVSPSCPVTPQQVGWLAAADGSGSAALLPSEHSRPWQVHQLVHSGPGAKCGSSFHWWRCLPVWWSRILSPEPHSPSFSLVPFLWPAEL